MELQWPLIIFTTLVAWSAGVFGTQAIMAWGGNAKKAQMPSWIVAAVLLVVGGIAVFFHLQHWDRIFNGFGHITSGITQELIMIVVLAVVAIVYLVLMRRSEDGASVPKWMVIVAVLASVVLVAVMAHSYMMVSRPAWDTVLWILYILGNACVLGPLTVAFIMAIRGDDTSAIGLVAIIGALIAVVTAIAYAAYLLGTGDSFITVGYYFDPTTPTSDMVDAEAVISALAPMVWIGGVVVGAVIPAIAAIVAKIQNNANAWKIWACIGIICAVIGAVIMRVAFYEAGMASYLFF